MTQNLEVLWRPAFTATFAAMALSGCSILFPEDPREGVEPLDECVARFADLARSLAEDNSEVPASPIYTFDVTKVAFTELQELIVPGSDETAGQRLMRQTNQESTAVAQFMTYPVDEAGIFFLGRDPALYRVRVADVWPRDVVQKGCEMQLSGMRLTDIDTATGITVEPEPSEDTSTEQETTS
ncbi:MAG: hypothetical protein ACX930_01230 [Erythrobacter sp.]